ncbi:MAG: hypothetical protein C4525_02965 [Desulfarculus sp.]|jgi:hypothetical protein|nr:MAG: hypothetical protein C4525_02965 [Desulfarculus sp.]
MKLFRAVALRLKQFIAENYQGKWTVFAKKCGVVSGSVKPWLDGKSLPSGKHLARMAMAGVPIDWLLTGRKPEAPPASDPADTARLRKELGDALTRIDALTIQHNAASQSSTQQARRALDLEEQVERLQRQLMTLGLGPDHLRLVEEIHAALGLGGPVDVDRVLRVVAASYRRSRSEPEASRVHEDGGQKTEGAGGRGVKKEREPQANSS